MKYNRLLYLSLFILIMVWSSNNAYGDMAETIDIHGFGGWAYGKTDNENQYLAGNEDGKYDTVDFSLNITATPYERLSLHVQTGYSEGSDDDEDVELEYAFAEWMFSEAAILRIGKVKAPFLLYTEMYKVGTVRPFFELPQSIYQDMTAEAYKGVGLTGIFYPTEPWEIHYDIYGGEMDLHTLYAPDTQNTSQNENFPFELSVTDTIGGRLIVCPPISGINFGISAFRGEIEAHLEDFGLVETSLAQELLVIGAFAEYLSEQWWIRTEYMTERENSQVSADIVYGEIAYMLTEQWQLAARYEYMDQKVTAPEFQDLPKSFNRHEELAFGINYWFTPQFVLKLSYHLVEGNRFARPEDPEQFFAAVEQGEFNDTTTSLILFGAQFSF